MMRASLPLNSSLTENVLPSGLASSASRILVLSRMTASAPRFGCSNTVGRVNSANASRAAMMGNGSSTPVRKAFPM